MADKYKTKLYELYNYPIYREIDKISCTHCITSLPSGINIDSPFECVKILDRVYKSISKWMILIYQPGDEGILKTAQEIGFRLVARGVCLYKPMQQPKPTTEFFSLAAFRRDPVKNPPWFGYCFGYTSHLTRTVSIMAIHVREALIRDFTRRGDSILDPFLGEGYIAETAISNGRKIIGYELQEYQKFDNLEGFLSTIPEQREIELAAPRQQLSLLDKWQES